MSDLLHIEPPDPLRKTRWSIADLLDADFPEANWTIPGIIPVGESVLGGRPKVGKSWFALQIAAAKGTGGRLFDQEVTQGKVLYLALEDSNRRLQERIKKMGIPRDALITLEREWKPLHKGGLDALLLEMEAGAYTLIIIDTLSRALPGVDQNEAEVIGPIMGQLQNVALNRNSGLVVIDHTRKPNGLNIDPIDDIMASTAKTAVADAILALYKDRGKAGATLKGRGRDIEEIDLRLFWDPLTCAWQCKGNNADIELTDRFTEILAGLDELGRAKPSAIAKLIGQDYSNTLKRLYTLTERGLVKVVTLDGEKCYEKI